MRDADARPKHVERCLQRLYRKLPGCTQDDLGAALGRDRSYIARQLAGQYSVPASELDVWCDVLDSLEPLNIIAERLGYRVVPHERAAPAATVERATFGLLAEVGRYGAQLSDALADGNIDDEERGELHQALKGVRVLVEELLSRTAGPG